MYKLLLLIGMLIMVVASIGCQQSGLSEEEIRSIVREEIALQLASGQVQYVIGQEVANQLASIDELTVSELYIKNRDGKITAEFCGGATDGYLNFLNPDGKRVVFLSDSGLTIHDDEHRVASFGTMEFDLGSGDIGGQLMLFNPDGKLIGALTSTENGDGMLVIYDKYGQVIFVAP